jgi:putative oxidoreductase
MTTLLGAYTGVAYSLMRIVFAFLYLSHGLKWLFGAFGGRPVPLTPMLTTAGVIETVGGTLMLFGFLTPWFAFLASGEMAVAYFMAHVPRGSIWPIQNGGEITVALCFGFLYFATHGSGPISLDAVLGIQGQTSKSPKLVQRM